jgi:nucleoside-diphosphate-sugar epimerase
MDTVVHLAGLVTDWASAKLYHHVIYDGTCNLLTAIDNSSITRFIYMSSLTVHAMTGHLNDDESAPRDMKAFPYGIAKAKSEDAIGEWASHRSNRDYAHIRPGFIIYGPHDQGSYIRAIDGILSGTFGFVNGGQARISYIYVKNLAYAINQLIQSPDLIKGPYNIADGDKTWREWVQCWSLSDNRPVPTLNVPYWAIVVPIGIMESVYRLLRIRKSPPLNLYHLAIARRDLVFQDQKFRIQFGYDPPYSFEESLRETIRYYHEWKLRQKA